MEPPGRSTAAQVERGMTLIEVMVSLTMLGAVLVTLGQGLTLGIRMNSESKTKLTNLGICKRVTESFKSQLQAAPEAFDGSTDTGSPYYAVFNWPANKPAYFDADGGEITTTGSVAQAAYQVTISVTDFTDNAGNTLTDTAGKVILKVLDVRVTSAPGAISSRIQNVSGSMRETTMKVEITRPAA